MILLQTNNNNDCFFSDIFYILQNTFQAILITDEISSYTVFTYKCGELQWGSSAPNIGFIASGDIYDDHSPNDETIACVNSPHSPWSNIIYRLSDGVLAKIY